MPLSRRLFLKSSLACAAAGRGAMLGLGNTRPQELPPRGAPSPALPRMIAQDFSRHFDPAYLSNGFIGIRPGPNPLAQAPTAVSGFVYRDIPYEMQALSPAPYPLMVDLEFNNVRMLERSDLVTVRRQELDMESGELLTEMSFSPGSGLRIDVQVLQFASRSTPSLLCQQVAITASAAARVSVIAGIGTAGVPGAVVEETAPEMTQIDLALAYRSHGDLSRLGTAVAVVPQSAIVRSGAPNGSVTGVSRTYDLNAAAGQTYRFQTIAATVSSFYHPEPFLEAIRLANWGAALGFDFLRAENRERWAELWKSRVKITGDGESQRVLDAAFFYLHSSVHASCMTGMPPFGLSQTGAYYGHSFWDTESWSLLPVMLATPETAKSLLEFRRRSLAAARKLAALYGYRGAQFPWEAAPAGGFETTPTFAATGWEEQHSTPDIALAFWEYQLGAGDEGFLKRATWPVLKSVADWIASRGVYTSRGFEIDHIMGPDEGLPNVNNDAYVNLICRMVLRAAARCAAKLNEAPAPAWQRAERLIVLPESHGVMLPCDNPPQGKAYPIGGLDMLTVHDPPLPQELLRKTFDYNERFRQQRPAPIGFAAAAIAATAAFLGYRDKARDLFRESWQRDWMPTFGMIKEAPIETYGCFLTNFGSLLQTVMLGFTGLRIREGNWRAYPASLPEGWITIEVDRIWVRGEPKRLIAKTGALAQLLD